MAMDHSISLWLATESPSVAAASLTWLVRTSLTMLARQMSKIPTRSLNSSPITALWCAIPPLISMSSPDRSRHLSAFRMRYKPLLHVLTPPVHEKTPPTRCINAYTVLPCPIRHPRDLRRLPVLMAAQALHVSVCTCLSSGSTTTAQDLCLSRC